MLRLTLALDIIFPNHFATFGELTSKIRAAKLEVERLFSPKWVYSQSVGKETHLNYATLTET